MTAGRLGALAATCILASAPVHATTIADFYGRWTLDARAGAQDVSGPDDGMRVLGKGMVISPHGSVSPAGTCDTFPPRYAIRSVRSVLADWLVRPGWLDLGTYRLAARAGFIATACPEAIVLAPDELLVNLGNGYIYLASRTR